VTGEIIGSLAYEETTDAQETKGQQMLAFSVYTG
jgi:hypothetical protein